MTEHHPDTLATSEVPAAALVPLPVDDAGRLDWQEIWLELQNRPWRTLALVPGDDATSTVEIARLLTALGRRHGESIGLADLRDAELHRAPALFEKISDRVAQGERVILATRSLAENLATLPLARAADCAVLCVKLGSTAIGPTKAAIERIGRQRFAGSLLLTDSQPRLARPASTGVAP